jgi:thermitase
MKNLKKILVINVAIFMLIVSVIPVVNSFSVKVSDFKTFDGVDLDKIYEEVKAELKEYEGIDSKLRCVEYYPGAPPDPNVAYVESGSVVVICRSWKRVESISLISFEGVSIDVKDKDKIPELNAFKVSVSDVDGFINKYKWKPWVRDIEKSYQCTAFWDPDDEYWDDQWGPKAINCKLAWNYQTGRGADVAIIDSGCDYEHEDITPQPSRGLSYNFVNDDDDPMDDLNHGTHCSGIIGATIDNGIGIAGVAPDCFMHYLKVLDSDGFGYTFEVSKAIVHAATRIERLKVISMSLGGPFPSVLEGMACKYAHALNVLIVASAGNGGNKAIIGYPARFKDVLSVGAVQWRTDSNNNKKPDPDELSLCDFSSGGFRADILAPGKDIISTVPGQKYASWQGTSMAAPHVAGVAALYFGEHPSHGPDLCKSVLLITAIPLPYGGKLINAAGALGLAKPRSITTPIMSKFLNLFPNINYHFIELLRNYQNLKI